MIAIGWKRFLIFTLSLAAFKGTGFAADRFYLYGDAGVNFVQDIRFDRIVGIEADSARVEIEPGGRGTLGAGFNLITTFAIEGEVGFSYNETKTYTALVEGELVRAKASATVIPYTLGFNWRPEIGEPSERPMDVNYSEEFFQKLRPSIGAGVGMATVVGDIEASGFGETFTDDGTDTVLTYYGKGSLAYVFSEAVDLALQYRVWGFPGFEIKETESQSVIAHTVGLVLRFNF